MREILTIDDRLKQMRREMLLKWMLRFAMAAACVAVFFDLFVWRAA
jgi:hypothetical protein